MKHFTEILVAILALFVVSCKKQDIKGEEITISNVTVAMKSTDGRVIVPADSNYSKTPVQVTVPLEISFSDAVPKRFSVHVSVNNDTVNNLIAAGKLTNSVLLPEAFYKLPSSVDVRFGLDHIDFNLLVDVTAIERNYGKDLVLAVELSDPGKSNTVAKGKETAIVVIHTKEVISSEEIHYIYYEAAGHILNIPEEGKIYPQNSTNLTVPVKVSLAGVAGDAFNVRLGTDPDSVQRLLDAGTLSNTVLLQEGVDYEIPDSVDFIAGKNEASFDMIVKVNALKDHFDKKAALALTLSEPTGHLLDTLRKTVVIVLDPSRLVEKDITNEGSTYTVQFENTSNSNEASPKFIDNNIQSKFLLFNFTTAWMQLQYPTPQYAGAYTLTSANDAPGRDPKDWQLLGSNDGNSWKVLDTRTNEDFPNRFQTKKYTFSNAVPYAYYRLNITANSGDGLFQCAEWRLIRRP